MKKGLSLLFSCVFMVVLLISCGRAADKTASAGTTGGKESPLLAALVAKGELPPLEQRLPEEPFVSSAPEVGKYGGIYRGAGFGPSSGQADTEALRYVGLVRVEPDLKTLTPFLLKSYEANSDYTVWTLKLRKGLKWSDGKPFTTDAFKFWYEDILQNAELTPSVDARLKTGGNLLKLEVVDEVTIKITFTDPYPAFDVVMMQTANADFYMWAPRHYLEKWHIKYNPDANTLAKSEGQQSWAQAFNIHKDKNTPQTDVNTPDMTPWILSRIDPQGNKYFDRNPYYFVVDKAGNQLPYIDQQISVLVADAQTRTLKLAGGELHAAGENPLPIRDYTLYKQGEQQGDYTTYLFDNTRGSDTAFTFNINHKDPVLRKIFNEVSFREAMSLAINRQQINDVLYFGKAIPRQAIPPATTSFIEPWMNDHMAAYDADGANKRLDDLGLKWNPAHTQRLRPDGKPFSIVLESTEEFAPQGEMVAEMWSAVGIKADFKQQERTFAETRFSSNDRDAQCFTFDGVAEFALRANPSPMRPAWRRDAVGFAATYTAWFDTNGREGEEPPQFIKDYRKLIDEWVLLAPNNPRYAEMGREFLKIHTENLWYIGIAVAPRVIMISNKLGNTPKEGTFAYDYRFWYPYRGDSWYFK
ncbi:peptide ABC transporter substrate-binding protein [Spirochaetia bacterium]|nr:peptide ABC transporter substrate-binding protein [Spirochaetia bacterium]